LKTHTHFNYLRELIILREEDLSDRAFSLLLFTGAVLLSLLREELRLTDADRLEEELL